MDWYVTCYLTRDLIAINKFQEERLPTLLSLGYLGVGHGKGRCGFILGNSNVVTSNHSVLIKINS